MWKEDGKFAHFMALPRSDPGGEIEFRAWNAPPSSSLRAPVLISPPGSDRGRAESIGKSRIPFTFTFNLVRFCVYSYRKSDHLLQQQKEQYHGAPTACHLTGKICILVAPGRTLAHSPLLHD
jgi:hypothetical protein